MSVSRRKIRKLKQPRATHCFLATRKMLRQFDGRHGCGAMKPARFRHYAPTTVDEAVALLARLAPDDGRVLAGGQSLVPTMAFRLARPAHLIDINGIVALDRLAVEKERLAIGAFVRPVALHRPVVCGPLGRLLATVVRHI